MIPNFVAGVEMAKPYGFETVDEAIASTTEGLDYFMQRGITPRFTTWCPEPTTPLGRDNPNGAPLEYHVRLLGAYREALERHGLRRRRATATGPGNAVFSVSSFMDTLDAVSMYEISERIEAGRPDHGRRGGDALAACAGRGTAAPRGDVRARYHEPERATYMVMRIINYTNVCVAQCDYCAFYVLPNQEGGYVLSRDDVFAKIDELLEVGGDLVAFNGGFNPKLPLDYYCDLFASVRERYGDRVEFYALTIAEFVFLADRAGLSYADAAARLRDAGVHWVTGGGSEILTEDFRARHAKFKYTVVDYFEAQKAIVEAGLKTTATMVIGFDETLDERLEHLQRTRDFQDETGGLFSFLCWTYKPYGTAFGGREIEPREYWRHIALSRIFLDNVAHIRTSVLTQNEDAFRALDYGADDFDLPIEDEVTQKAGAASSSTSTRYSRSRARSATRSSTAGPSARALLT